VFWLADIDHPTTFLVQMSRTTARKRKPAQVGT
jgi:hypothetical protein